MARKVCVGGRREVKHVINLACLEGYKAVDKACFPMVTNWHECLAYYDIYW